MRILTLNETVTASNDRDADVLREKMRQAGTLLFNVMSSPGAGKTTLLSRIIRDLNDLKIAVMEADIESDVDAARIEVSDNGPGVPEDIEPHIFEPLSQLRLSML